MFSRISRINLRYGIGISRISKNDLKETSLISYPIALRGQIRGIRDNRGG